MKRKAAVENKVTEEFGTNLQVFDSKKVKYELIKDLKKAKFLAEKLSKVSLFVFDTETDGLNQFHLKLVGVSFSTKPSEGFFIAINPFLDKGDLFDKKLDDRLSVKDFVKLFKPIFENKKIRKVCQNGKYDTAVMRNIGIDVKNFYFDTMLASYCLDPDQKHGMDDLSQKYLGYQPIPFSNLLDVKKDLSEIFDVDLTSLSNYSSEDAGMLLFAFTEKLEQRN